MSNSSEPKYPIHTLEKAFQIIEYMKKNSDHRGVSLTEISKSLNLCKSSTHRILDTMLYYSIVEKTSAPITRYRLGWGLYNAGRLVPSFHPIESSNYKKHVDDLSTAINKKASFHICSNNYSVPVHEAGSMQSDHLNNLFNRHFPLYASAAGKLFMLNYSEEDILSYFHNTEIRRFTQNTILNFIDFLDELKNIEKLGYAVDNGEYSKDEFSIAMPVKDHTRKTIAAVSISMGNSLSQENIREVLPNLKECCNNISSFLGYSE